MLAVKTVSTVTLCCTSGFFGSSNSIIPRSNGGGYPLVFAASATTTMVTPYNQHIKSSVIVNAETLFVILEHASTGCW